MTGGAGFLGANLAHALVARGARVTALDGFLFGGGASMAMIRSSAPMPPPLGIEMSRSTRSGDRKSVV